MKNSQQVPLAYESKRDFRSRRRFRLQARQIREAVRFTVWMFGLFLAGLVVCFVSFFLR